MPVATIEKKVKCRADRIKPELRQKFGVTADQMKSKVGVVVETLQVPDYKSFDEMLADVTAQKNGDVEAAKKEIFGWADTQMATDLANSTRKKYEAPPVSKSVTPNECIIWAKEHEKQALTDAIASDAPGALESYLAGVKEKILAEREAAVAAGTAVAADEDETGETTEETDGK